MSRTPGSIVTGEQTRHNAARIILKAWSTVAARMAVRSPGKTCRSVIAGVPVRASPNQTRPTGLSALPPEGPATPVTATAMAARDRSKGAVRHRGGNLFADRPMGLDQWHRHADHLVLGLVGVGDEAAVHHVG